MQWGMLSALGVEWWPVIIYPYSLLSISTAWWGRHRTHNNKPLLLRIFQWVEARTNSSKSEPERMPNTGRLCRLLSFLYQYVTTLCSGWLKRWDVHPKSNGYYVTIEWSGGGVSAGRSFAVIGNIRGAQIYLLTVYFLLHRVELHASRFLADACAVSPIL